MSGGLVLPGVYEKRASVFPGGSAQSRAEAEIVIYVVAVGYDRFLVLAVSVLALCASAACGGSEDTPPPTGNAGSHGIVGCEGRGDQFSAGMTKQSDDGALQVVLEKADIAPPGQGLNTWTLEITDAAGAVSGADVQASSRMPDHTHPAVKKTGSETEPGVYEIIPYFAMPGYWETVITVTPTGGSRSSVLFAFCIAD